MPKHELAFQGPFRCGVHDENRLPPAVAGVYFATIQTPRGRFATYVGQSSNIRHRWWQHFLHLRGGYYRVYDQELMAAGIGLKIVYEQLDPSYLLTRFTKEIADLAWRNLLSYDWFWAELEEDATTLKGIESALIATLASAGGALLLQNSSINGWTRLAQSAHATLEWPLGISIEGLPGVIRHSVPD